MTARDWFNRGEYLGRQSQAVHGFLEICACRIVFQARSGISSNGGRDTWRALWIAQCSEEMPRLGDRVEPFGWYRHAFSVSPKSDDSIPVVVLNELMSDSSLAVSDDLRSRYR